MGEHGQRGFDQLDEESPVCRAALGEFPDLVDGKPGEPGSVGGNTDWVQPRRKFLPGTRSLERGYKLAFPHGEDESASPFASFFHQEDVELTFEQAKDRLRASQGYEISCAHRRDGLIGVQPREEPGGETLL
ncbi:MAG: hypothetical protein P8R42_11545 [Candidatus Binatia bacterium]|nr:hypothetical protein [Candidatus Binatia bacterium]